MIIVNFSNGLGNQMFQYALYRVFKEYGKNIKADTTWFEKNPVHNGFEIETAFNLKLEQSTEIENFMEVRNNYIDQSIDQWYEYNKEILKIDNGYLDGYWENANYFKDYRDEIIKCFTFKIEDKENLEILKEIQKGESVSIHIRRGDFLDEGTKDLFMGIATIDYYKKAIEIIKRKVENPKFFIFSDDLDWVKQNLKLEKSIYVDINRGKNSFKDMCLISKCNHNIMANSTFSWWGAWLNQNKNKIVICPSRFYNKKPYGMSIYCDDWIKCDIDSENNIYDGRSIKKFQILGELFEKQKYDVILKLTDVDDNYVYYYLMRIFITKNRDKDIQYYFEKCIKNLNYEWCSLDYDVYLSTYFYYGKYFFNKGKYEIAENAFNYLDSISKGKHMKAKEYLEKIKILTK